MAVLLLAFMSYTMVPLLPNKMVNSDQCQLLIP